VPASGAVESAPMSKLLDSTGAVTAGADRRACRKQQDTTLTGDAATNRVRPMRAIATTPKPGLLAVRPCIPRSQQSVA
jgi:hypothetical protein